MTQRSLCFVIMPFEKKPDPAGGATVIREKWEPETTANNLKLIEWSRAARGQGTSWLK